MFNNSGDAAVVRPVDCLAVQALHFIPGMLHFGQ